MPSQPAPPTALVGVTVFDGSGGEALPNRTVLVEAGRIEGIYRAGEAPIDSSYQVMALQGHFVIPGLVDTHAHMPGVSDQPRFLGNLLGFGVTTARSTAAEPSGGVELRSRIASGEILGPRFLTAGRLIDGPGSVWGDFGRIVETEADIRAEVRAQSAQGVDMVKLYTGLAPDLVRAAIDEGEAVDVPIIGHLGRTSWSEAVAAGIDGLTHGCFWGMTRSVVPRADSARFDLMFIPGGSFGTTEIEEWPGVLDLSDARLREMIDRMVAQGTAWDPNIVLCEAVVFGDVPEVRARLLPEFDVRAADFPHPYSANWSAETRAAARAAFPTMLQVVREFHSSGVLVTLGSDTMNPWMTPGAAALRELELLVQAGLTPSEALLVGTRNGAQALGILDEVGTIEPGKAADLIVLDADPTVDISNVREIEYVVRAGRLHRASELLRR